MWVGEIHGDYLAVANAKKRGRASTRVEVAEAANSASEASTPERSITDRQLLTRLIDHLERELPAKGQTV